MLDKVFDYTMGSLVIINLFLGGLYLTSKLVDIARNGFEHSEQVFIRADASESDSIDMDFDQDVHDATMS